MIDYDDPYLEDLYLTLYEDLLEGVEICFDWKNPWQEAIKDLNKEVFPKTFHFKGPVFNHKLGKEIEIEVKWEPINEFSIPVLNFPTYPIEETFIKELEKEKEKVYIIISSSLDKKQSYLDQKKLYEDKTKALKVEGLSQIYRWQGNVIPNTCWLIQVAVDHQIFYWLKTTSLIDIVSIEKIRNNRINLPGLENKIRDFFEDWFFKPGLTGGHRVSKPELEQILNFCFRQFGEEQKIIKKINPDCYSGDLGEFFIRFKDNFKVHNNRITLNWIANRLVHGFTPYSDRLEANVLKGLKRKRK